MSETITHETFLATLRERFGESPAAWAFVCPQCADVATGADFRAALKAHPRERRGEAVTASDLMGQECIGRTLGALTGPAEKWKGRGCDWCAYGLIGGPLGVEMPDGKVVRSFSIARARENAETREAVRSS